MTRFDLFYPKAFPKSPSTLLLKWAFVLLIWTFSFAGVSQTLAQGVAATHVGVYRLSDQQWLPGAQVQVQDDVLFDNTNFSGGYLPPDQTPAGGPPVVLLDWGTTPGGMVQSFEIGYATSQTTPVHIKMHFYTGTTDDANGEEIASYDFTNLPGSTSGQVEVMLVTLSLDTQPLMLPSGPFGYAYEITDTVTGPLTATGGPGATDGYRVFPDLTKLLIVGFFAQFHLKLLGTLVRTWFVDNARPAGDGSFSNPFNNLPAAQAASGPFDTIFLYKGNGPYGGIALKPGQHLVGHGLGLIENGQVVVEPDTPPVIQLTSPGVEMASGSSAGGMVIEGSTLAIQVAAADDVFVRDVQMIGVGTGIDIVGGSGTFTFSDITIDNPTDAGIDIIGSSGTFTFSDISITNPTDAGIDIIGGSGTFTFSDISITNPGETGTGLRFDGADGTYGFDGTITLAGGDAGIDILGDSHGTFTFSDVTITSPTTTGVTINASGADVTFDRLAVAGGKTGVRVEGGGKVRIKGGTLRDLDEDGVVIKDAEEIRLEKLLMEILARCIVAEPSPRVFEISETTCRGIQDTNVFLLAGEKPSYAPKSGAIADTSYLMIDHFTVTNTAQDALFVTTKGNVIAKVTITNSTLNTTGQKGLSVGTLGASKALVTLTGNTVSAATTDITLAQEGDSRLLLDGFIGGSPEAVIAFLQANNVGTPSVEILGLAGTGTGVAVEDEIPVPTTLHLDPGYPNPFRETTTFAFRVSEAAPAQLHLYNLQGRLIRTLIDQVLTPGTHTVVWDGLDTQGQRVASGLYLARLHAGGIVSHQKIMRIR